MILLLDIGNTNIVGAFALDNKLFDKFYIASNSENLLNDLKKKILSKKLEAIIVASVVPKIDAVIAKILKDITGLEAIFIKDHKNKLPIKNLTEKPDEVGDDRIINALACHKEFSDNVVAIDCGTATTFDIVSKDGEYIGGIIAPGIDLSISTLHSKTAKLPKIEFAKPNSVIGKNTEHAMQSGIFFGYLGLIESLLQRINEELQQSFTVIVTGGNGKLLCDNSNILKNYDADLTLKGILLSYNYLKEINEI